MIFARIWQARRLGQLLDDWRALTQEIQRNGAMAQRQGKLGLSRRRRRFFDRHSRESGNPEGWKLHLRYPPPPRFRTSPAASANVSAPWARTDAYRAAIPRFTPLCALAPSRLCVKFLVSECHRMPPHELRVHLHAQPRRVGDYQVAVHYLQARVYQVAVNRQVVARGF